MEQKIFEKLYVAFNARNFDELLMMMHPDVEWENGMQGGFIHGREAVREYWRKQFEFITSHLEPLKFETDDAGREIVGVRLAVSDLQGHVLLDKVVKHIFTFHDDLIVKFEIADTIPFSETEGLADISGPFAAAMKTE